MRICFLLTNICCLIILTIGISCNRIESGEKLSKSDLSYLKGLGLLEDNEKVILFDTHSGGFNSIHTSGNYFTDKRIAAYWIDNDHKEKTSMHYAYFNEIDTITLTDLSKEWTSASYLTIQKIDGQNFKVYISADSSNTRQFYDKAVNEWKNKR